MISVKELTKRYARTVAVNHVSFEVAKGEIVGFLGPNGAGKTTTMRMLTGFLLPTSGTATVAGFDVLEKPLEVKRRIGYLPETPPLYHEMITDEYLSFVGKLKGLFGAELSKRIDHVCERCAITDVKRKQLGKLSRGYRQRVGLAQAIIHNPEVLILDEPTAGLDPKQIIETRDLIRGLAGNHTIVLSTHILPEVAQTCQRVVIINKGRVVAGDTRVAPADLKPDSGAFEVESERGRDIRRDLAREIVTRGWGLLELRPMRMSLEEVFLQVTTEDAAVIAAPEAEAPHA